MNAAIIALGSELLGTTKLDNNSLRITKELEKFGVSLIGKSTIGDDEESIEKNLEYWLTHAEIILLTGGLGPTTDDVTRSAVASALGKKLFLDTAIEKQLARRFSRMGRHMTEINRKQAMMIPGGQPLENGPGTAPGIRIKYKKTTIFLFPGVPREVQYMITTHLHPWLQEHTKMEKSKTVIHHAILKISCLPESEVEQLILPAYKEFGKEWITILGSPGEVTLRLKARGEESECQTRLTLMQQRLCELIGTPVFTTQDDESLEFVLGSLLKKHTKTIATAESCTGGLLAERLTRVPGSSDYFLGGHITYSDQSKVNFLGISHATIQKYGAVSKEIAMAMAKNIRLKYESDYGVGITGIAGPDGGSLTKPVGTVHICIVGSNKTLSRYEQRVFSGDRTRIRLQSAQWALEMLRQLLIKT